MTDLLIGEVIPARTPEQWAQVIRADLGQAVAGFVAAGQHLTQAREQHRYLRNGDGFQAWCKEQIGIGKEMARQLIRIGEYYPPILTNVANALATLPPSWATLFELTPLDAPLLESAISAGHVHPQLERKAAAALVVEYRKAAAVEAARSVQPGQWWQLGEHLLYCGDSADEAFTSRLEPAAFAFADPPYNADKAEWDSGFTWRHDYLADRAGIVAVTPGISAIYDFAAVTKMPYRWSMAAWIANGMTRGALGFGNWIYVGLFSRAESLHRNAQDFIKINVSTAAPSTQHESRKPAELLVSLLETFTAEDDAVIDPFLGSGTTLFAAEQTGRRCIGAEIRPEFCAEIITRYGADEAKPL